MERLPDPQAEVELQPRMLGVEFAWQSDLSGVRLNLDDAFAPFKKITQAPASLASRSRD
jgi:hypothetical protein